MWLAAKNASKKPPRRKVLPVAPMAVRQKQLGVEGAIEYRKLFENHPDVERGPDEDLQHHYERLKVAEKAYQDEVSSPIQERRQQAREEGKLRAPVFEENPTDAWVGQLPTGAPEPAPPVVSDLKGMPQRIPGWFTGDAMDSAPPGYGVPPMSRRTPGAKLRGPTSPNAAPLRQTRDEWLKGLADKGIYLNGDGTRMTPEEMVLPSRPGSPVPRGHDIWSDLIDRPATPGRHRAAMVVTAYIRELLPKNAAGVHEGLLGDDWQHRGNYYHKTIGDKIHVLVPEGGGWIHNTGPVGGASNEYGDPEMTGTPVMFDDLQTALMHANRGQVQVGFRPPPVNRQSLSSNSWSEQA